MKIVMRQALRMVGRGKSDGSVVQQTALKCSP
jgi:hypothetical protein